MYYLTYGGLVYGYGENPESAIISFIEFTDKYLLNDNERLHERVEQIEEEIRMTGFEITTGSYNLFKWDKYNLDDIRDMDCQKLSIELFDELS